MHSSLLNSKLELTSSIKILKIVGLYEGINISIFLIIFMYYSSMKINNIEKMFYFHFNFLNQSKIHLIFFHILLRNCLILLDAIVP